jgi:hypothetical protein
MLEDNEFADLIHKRYFELRKTILGQAFTDNIIDSVATLLNEAQTRHFQKWNTLGINTGTPESGIQPATYSGVIAQFKDWIKTRLTWLDANMVGSDILSVEKNSAELVKCRVFPNPVVDQLFIESDMEIESFNLYNLAGINVVKQDGLCSFFMSANLAHLPQGFYIGKILFSNGEIATTKVLKK